MWGPPASRPTSTVSGPVGCGWGGGGGSVHACMGQPACPPPAWVGQASAASAACQALQRHNRDCLCSNLLLCSLCRPAVPSPPHLPRSLSPPLQHTASGPRRVYPSGCLSRAALPHAFIFLPHSVPLPSPPLPLGRPPLSTHQILSELPAPSLLPSLCTPLAPRQLEKKHTAPAPPRSLPLLDAPSCLPAHTHLDVLAAARTL